MWGRGCHLGYQVFIRVRWEVNVGSTKLCLEHICVSIPESVSLNMVIAVILWVYSGMTFFFFFCGGTGLELRALHLQSRLSTT
jgi:hypothetical protein